MTMVRRCSDYTVTPSSPLLKANTKTVRVEMTNLGSAERRRASIVSHFQGHHPTTDSVSNSWSLPADWRFTQVSSTGCLGLELFVGSCLQGTKLSVRNQSGRIVTRCCKKWGFRTEPITRINKRNSSFKAQEMVDEVTATTGTPRSWSRPILNINTLILPLSPLVVDLGLTLVRVMTSDVKFFI